VASLDITLLLQFQYFFKTFGDGSHGVWYNKDGTLVYFFGV